MKLIFIFPTRQSVYCVIEYFCLPPSEVFDWTGTVVDVYMEKKKRPTVRNKRRANAVLSACVPNAVRLCVLSTLRYRRPKLWWEAEKRMATSG